MACIGLLGQTRILRETTANDEPVGGFGGRCPTPFLLDRSSEKSDRNTSNNMRNHDRNEHGEENQNAPFWSINFDW